MPETDSANQAPYKELETPSEPDFQIDPQAVSSFIMPQAGHGGACHPKIIRGKESWVPGQPGVYKRPCLKT